MNAIPYFGLNVASAGVVEDDPAVHDVAVAKDSTSYLKVILRGGVVVGMVAVGDTSKCGIIHSLMKCKVKVDDWKDTLVRQDFGLLSLPDSLWRSHLTPAE